MLTPHPFLAGEGTVLMAHRGGGAEVQENSRAALQHVVDLGLTYVETDAHATRDGVVVLQHDEELDRTTDATGLLTSRRWEDLAEVCDASGGGLVRLDEALEEFPTLKFNVDAKSDGVVGPLVDLARRHPDRILIASFSEGRLARARHLAPEVATSLGPRDVRRLVVASRFKLSIGRWIASHHESLTEAVAVQVPPRHGVIDVVRPQFVRLAHALGLEVHVWGVDSSEEWERMLAYGVDGIVTDHPTAARDLLRARGPIR